MALTISIYGTCDFNRFHFATDDICNTTFI